jgi:thiamine-monophosphate kinase
MTGIDHSADRGERAFVRRLAELLGSGPPGAAAPFGDDMAGVPGSGRLLWSTDMLLDGVDFLSEKHPWRTIGRKAMAVNLSDCAAMGARPLAALCAVTAGPGLTVDDLMDLHAGAQEIGLANECPIVGGDTNEWGNPTAIAITVLALADEDVPPVLRNGAQPGDALWVSGPLGGSILGRHLWFEPRVPLGRTIAAQLRPHAMMDISDGLVIDLARMLEASGCTGAELDEALMSAAIHADARQLSADDGKPPIEHALYDGEDFELLIALPPDASAAVCSSLGLIHIGRILEQPRREAPAPSAKPKTPSILLAQARGGIRPLEIRGWEYLR